MKIGYEMDVLSCSQTLFGLLYHIQLF